jgi:hypothetical protein
VTRATQVTATREQAAADAEVCAPQNNEKTSVIISRSAVEVPSVCAWSFGFLLVFINKIHTITHSLFLLRLEIIVYSYILKKTDQHHKSPSLLPSNLRLKEPQAPPAPLRAWIAKLQQHCFPRKNVGFRKVHICVRKMAVNSGVFASPDRSALPL